MKEEVGISIMQEIVDIRYTLDGSVPAAKSALLTGPVRIESTAVVSVRCFREGKAVSPASVALFTTVKPRPGIGVTRAVGGVPPDQGGFFDKTGGDGLTVEWEGPGFERAFLPDLVLYQPR